MDNTDNTIDLLQIKIEKAKSQLTDETLNAINAVDWKDAILKMRASKGYSFEQLGALETETELVLCGLLNPKDYPKELENRMGISKTQTNDLVNEMNKQVFSKIKEELIKSSEKKNSPLEEYPLGGGGNIIHPGASATQEEGKQQTTEEQKRDTQVLNTAGIEIIPEKLELHSPLEEYPLGGGGQTIPPRPDLGRDTPQEGNKPTPSILEQKLSAPMQTETVKTDHSLPNITPTTAQNKPTIDPYREIPE